MQVPYTLIWMQKLLKETVTLTSISIRLSSSHQFLMVIMNHEIILANWPSYKCPFNNNIPVDIPSHPYVLLNQSILCNCDVEAESNFF